MAFMGQGNLIMWSKIVLCFLIFPNQFADYVHCIFHVVAG